MFNSVHVMAWLCRKCKKFLTYRRDKVCQKCKPQQRRGARNAKKLRIRLRSKTDPRQLKKGHYDFKNVVRSETKTASLKQWASAIEAESAVLGLAGILSRSGFHSVLSHCHALAEGVAGQEGQRLPPLTDAYLLGLIFCGMSLSTRLLDPDELRPQLLKKKNRKVESHLPMKSVIHAQCVWVNLMQFLRGPLLDS